MTPTMDYQPSPIPIKGMMYVCIYLCGKRGLLACIASVTDVQFLKSPCSKVSVRISVCLVPPQ